jgi:choice-of-anchor A domain-containing protein
MHRFRHFIFALGLCAAVFPAFALDLNLGVAAQYSAFIFGNGTNLSDVEGRVAVGGNFFVTGTNIGAVLPTGSTGPSLVVGGNIDCFNYGTINAGKKVIGYGTYGGVKASKVPANLDLRQAAPPFSFAAERAYLSALSDELAALEPTGTVVQQYAAVTLTGGNKNLEVFRLEADQVKSTLNFQLKNVAKSAVLVLNIHADAQRSVRVGIVMSALSSQKNKVILNFPDTRILNFTSVQVVGSVLAPYACVCDSVGHIDGTIIADTWDSDMAVGYAPFTP